MKIRPKNIVYAAKGVQFSLGNEKGKNWRRDIFNKQIRGLILDKLRKYGKDADDYGLWLNDMQSRHAELYQAAGGEDNNWENESYWDPDGRIHRYQADYKGLNENFSGPLAYGNISYDIPDNRKIILPGEDRIDFNQYGIRPNQESRYVVDGKRISGDYSRGDYDYEPDNLYSAITDDRRLLGRKGDWDDEEDFNKFKEELAESGWTIELDSDNYYKLKRIPANLEGETPEGEKDPDKKNDQVPEGHSEYTTFWDKLKNAGKGILDNPNLYSAGRFINDWIWNERIYDEALKGIRPELMQTYKTHRQVVGDEATKQAYYRRAAQGQTRAAQPFTSDADKQMAYQMEAKRIGDELRAQGDLADNQEIRRTSDESNQHQWSNTQRETEVANYNRKSLIQANALKHNLLAQKYSAQGSSIDNLLKEIQTRKLEKQDKIESLNDQIFALREAQYEDLDFIEARNRYNDILKSKTDPTTKKVTWDSEMLAAREDYLRAVARHNEESLIRKKRYISGEDPFIYKQGSKIVRKRKDDLLYKSGRDTVEHFRKMSKLSSDAQNRKKPKIEKLAPHPKGSTRKYQQGGVAPFLVYTPAVRGGETTTSSETSTSSTKKSDKDDGQELLKKLFERLYQAEGLGLPSDLNAVFSSMRELINKQQAFGNELSTDEIQMEYLEQMQNLNILKFNQKQFEKIQQKIVSDDAQHEYAIDNSGKIAAQSRKTGKVKFMDWEDIKEDKEYVPITNQTLLHLRAYSPDLAFDRSTLEAVANNGIGLSKIVQYLNNEISQILGTSTEKIEGYTQKESDIIREGLLLLKDAPEGVYKFSKLTKDQNDQIDAALAYLTLTLPRGMKNVLDTRAKMVGISYNDVIKLALKSKNSPTSELSFDAMTGKAAKDANGNSSSKADGESENSAALAFVLGQGPRVPLDFNPGTSNAIRVLGIKGVLQDNQKNNLGQGATLQDVSRSQFAFLDLNKATFGGSRLNPAAYSHIILNDSTIIGMNLPYMTDLNGNDVPDFTLCQKMEEADKVIAEQKIDPNDYEKINEVYKSKGLPLKYDNDGNLNTINYKRFAGIQVTLDENSLTNKEAILSDEVAQATDVERDLYEASMKKQDKNYDLDNGWPVIHVGKEKLYKGTLFISYDEDIAFAALSGGRPFKQNLPNNSAEVQLRQYAPKAKTYNAPAKTYSQIK